MGNIAHRNISLGNIVLHHKQPSTHSLDFDPDVELLEKRHRVVAPHYGNVKLVRDKNTCDLMFLKEIFVNTKEAFDQELRFFNNRIVLKHPNVVNILGFTSEETKNFCSNYFKISIFFEVMEKDLQTDLEERIKESKYYSENELFIIADNLTSALSYFQNQGHAHGDIRPFNIFVKGYTHKLSDPSLNPEKLSNGLTLAIVEGAKALLAPELLEQVPPSLFEIKTDIHKADVFSLGATLLGLATLTNSDDMCDYKTGKIDTNILEERLEAIKSRYSVVAYDLIKSMLTINVNERPDFFMIANRLLPYQQEIRSLKPLPFASLGLAPYEPVHIDTHIHQYDVGAHHHYEEIVKKTGPTGMETHTYTHDYQAAPQTKADVSSNDVLDAQIKAAIDRTEETLKAFSNKEATPYPLPITIAPLSYEIQSATAGDLTSNYLVNEKESFNQSSYRLTASSNYTDFSQRPGEIYSTPSDSQTTPSFASMYSAGVSQPEGLLGSLLVQNITHDIEKLTHKLEEEGLISVQGQEIINDPYPEVVWKKPILEAVSLSKEDNIVSEEQAPVIQEEVPKEGRISVDENQPASQKEKEPEAQSGLIDTLPDRNVKRTREIRQEPLGRQEGQIELMDPSGDI